MSIKLHIFQLFKQNIGAAVQGYDDVIKWKHFPRYWPFVRGIQWWPENSPHKGQWRGALMFSLIFAWMYGWVHTGEAGDLRRHRAHYDVIVMHQIWKQNYLVILDICCPNVMKAKV